MSINSPRVLHVFSNLKFWIFIANKMFTNLYKKSLSAKCNLSKFFLRLRHEAIWSLKLRLFALSLHHIISFIRKKVVTL